jgi:hypothetical protein
VSRILALATLVLFAGCPCVPTKIRTPLDARLVTDARVAVERAWRTAQLPAIDLSDVEVLVAEDCESFFRSCWPYRAQGCPGQTAIASECAPTSDLVVLSFSEPVASRPHLAIHGMLHDALRQGGSPDYAHADTRVWAGHGDATVEARARATLTGAP